MQENQYNHIFEKLMEIITLLEQIAENTKPIRVKIEEKPQWSMAELNKLVDASYEMSDKL